MSTVNEILAKLEEFKQNVTYSLQEVYELDVSCKSLLHRHLNSTGLCNSSTPLQIQAIIDYMYEKINIGNWKEVKLYLRKTITIASYLKLITLIKSSNKLEDSLIKEAFKIIDFGILFGCPLDEIPKLLQKCAAILNTYVEPDISISNSLSNLEATTLSSIGYKYNATPIDVIDCPSMENFYSNYILKEKPVILANCMNHWPALSKWKDQNYFLKLAGMRTVSIELGSKYTDAEWTQKLMTIGDFIKQHIWQTNGPTGYLAQYQLFDQIPELKEDIVEPEYCCFAEGDEAVDVMAWYGPKGTLSPLHHDPKKNLLAQVIGEKQLFLFSPNDSEFLYPHEHELMNNTARVDPREPDFVKYPNYKDAKAYYCVLQPGQMLYIPTKWWHFVESLSVSFSVSFWWK